MGLNAGTKLGPYEILGALGAGGMGEVYKARDTRLDRTVAIKVLPAHLSSNPDLKQRFEREAKAISSLQHPHICTLFDVGHQDGTDFLVMEYLEGETLADRLQKSPLPLEQALKVGIEVAGALDKAHRQAIVHRDLKPGNIMLTKSGAKLMDFGLAKPASPVMGVAGSAAGPITPSTPTMSLASLSAPASPLTQKGTVVGTFQYMAPEVLQGAEADARSDIFSFGCVLYEMATGRRAFEGKSQLSVLTAILEKDPDPISAHRPLTPPALEHIVHGCLAKSPESRVASAHDVRLELEWIADQPAPPAATAPSRSRWERMIWVAALVLCAAAALYFGLRRPTPQVTRSSILAPAKATLDAVGYPGSFAVSPDGQAVAYVAGLEGVDRLYVRYLRDAEARQLPGTEGALYPFWSPDSRSIGFFTPDSLKRIDVSGGPPITVAPAPSGRGGSWASDDTIYFAPSTSTPISRIPVSGGAAVPITQVESAYQDTHRWPFLLPDGKHLVFLGANHANPNSEHTGIFWASTDGRQQHLLVHSASNAAYSGGYLLYTRDATLMAQKMDQGAGRLIGEPVVVVDGVQVDPSTWRASFAADRNGSTLVYIGGSIANLSHLTWLDENGKPTREITSPPSPVSVRFSRTGNKLLAVAGQPQSSVWTTDLGRNVTARFTFERDHQSAVWSPDGKYIAYCERETGRFQLWEKAASGTEAPRRLLESQTDDCPGDWSPDGKTLAFVRNTNNNKIWLLPLTGDRKPYPLLENAKPEDILMNPSFSPDGRWLAYTTRQPSDQVEVTAIPGRAGKWQVSSSGGAQPFWRSDGKELFYVDDSNHLMAVSVNGAGSEFQAGAPHVVAQLNLVNPTGAMQTIDASPTGKGFAAVLRIGGASEVLSLVQNWVAELKK